MAPGAPATVEVVIRPHPDATAPPAPPSTLDHEPGRRARVGPALRDGVALYGAGVRLGDVQVDLAVGGHGAVDLDGDLRITRRS